LNAGCPEKLAKSTAIIPVRKTPSKVPSPSNRDNGSSQTLKLAKIEEIRAYQSMKEQKERQSERNVLKLVHSLVPSRATLSRDYPEPSLIGSYPDQLGAGPHPV
jgi:hypothetical protein